MILRGKFGLRVLERRINIFKFFLRNCKVLFFELEIVILKGFC